MFSIIFYLFSFIAISASVLVISCRNPVHSVLSLIVTFIAVACIFILLGAEFLAMLIMIVYVGAVAVLFLFVVMMLDVDFVQLRVGLSRYLPAGIIFGIVMVFELGLLLTNWKISSSAAENIDSPIPINTSNTIALSKVLYTDYIYLFQSAGLILFVAMIGAIVLTFRENTDVKRQNVVDQMQRDGTTSVKLIDVKPGEGL
jgi:NADH-quinone oxidoreductase subunit J